MRSRRKSSEKQEQEWSGATRSIDEEEQKGVMMSRRSRSWISRCRRESRVPCYREGEVTPLLLGEGGGEDTRGMEQVGHSADVH